MSETKSELLGKSVVVQRGTDFYFGLFEETPSGYALSDPIHVGYEPPTRFQKLIETRMSLQQGDMIAGRGRIFYLRASNELAEAMEVEFLGGTSDIYFTGMVKDKTVTPVTIDRISPYFRGSGMARTVLNQAAESDPKLTKDVKVYRITRANPEGAKDK